MPDRLGEVPCPTVGIRRRVRGRAMSRASVLCRCTGVCRRTQQRMPELNPTVAEGDQTQVLSLTEATDIETQSGGHFGDQPEVSTAHCGHEQDRPALALEVREPSAECLAH